MEDRGERTLSVIVCVRDGARDIGRQLEALEHQQGAGAYEVVVVDNGSRDGTRQIVLDWMEKSQKSEIAAKLISIGDPPGIPRGRNAGALVASGEILAYCDADDAVGPGWVAAIKRGMPAAGMVGGHAVAVTRNGEPRPEVTVSSLVESVYLPFAPGCNFAVTADAFRAVGGFDETLPAYGFDDVDFSWRIQEAGYPLLYLPNAEILFTVSDRLSSIKKQYMSAKARMGVVARHPGYADKGHTMSSALKGAAKEAALFPLRMVRPGNRTRATHARYLVSALGFVDGVWTYLRRDPPPPRVRAQCPSGR